jgi:hypothetical protein
MCCILPGISCYSVTVNVISHDYYKQHTNWKAYIYFNSTLQLGGISVTLKCTNSTPGMRFFSDPFKHFSRLNTVALQLGLAKETWNKFSAPSQQTQEPGSSGSLVSDYGLDDCAIGVRSPAGAKDFSSDLSVQTGSGAHPASCTMGTGGPFPGGKSAAGAWRWPLTPI